MKLRLPSARGAAVVCLLAFLPALQAQSKGEHVVPLSSLHQDAQDAAGERQANLTKLDRFFAGERAATALKAVNMNGEQVRRAVSMLSDAELASLSERASTADAGFSAGALSNQELTYIIIALATAVIILVIVAA